MDLGDGLRQGDGELGNRSAVQRLGGILHIELLQPAGKVQQAGVDSGQGVEFDVLQLAGQLQLGDRMGRAVEGLFIMDVGADVVVEGGDSEGSHHGIEEIDPGQGAAVEDAVSGRTFAAGAAAPVVLAELRVARAHGKLRDSRPVEGAVTKEGSRRCELAANAGLGKGELPDHPHRVRQLDVVFILHSAGCDDAGDIAGRVLLRGVIHFHLIVMVVIIRIAGDKGGVADLLQALVEGQCADLAAGKGQSADLCDAGGDLHVAGEHSVVEQPPGDLLQGLREADAGAVRQGLGDRPLDRRSRSLALEALDAVRDVQGIGMSPANESQGLCQVNAGEYRLAELVRDAAGDDDVRFVQCQEQIQFGSGVPFVLRLRAVRIPGIQRCGHTAGGVIISGIAPVAGAAVHPVRVSADLRVSEKISAFFRLHDHRPGQGPAEVGEPPGFILQIAVLDLALIRNVFQPIAAVKGVLAQAESPADLQASEIPAVLECADPHVQTAVGRDGAEVVGMKLVVLVEGGEGVIADIGPVDEVQISEICQLRVIEGALAHIAEGAVIQIDVGQEDRFAAPLVIKGVAPDAFQALGELQGLDVLHAPESAPADLPDPLGDHDPPRVQVLVHARLQDKINGVGIHRYQARRRDGRNHTGPAVVGADADDRLTVEGRGEFQGTGAVRQVSAEGCDGVAVLKLIVIVHEVAVRLAVLPAVGQHGDERGERIIPVMHRREMAYPVEKRGFIDG